MMNLIAKRTISLGILILMLVGSTFSTTTRQFDSLMANLKPEVSLHISGRNEMVSCMFEISLSVDRLTFDVGEEAVISGKLKNMCDCAVNLDNIGFFSLKLSKRQSDDRSPSRRGESFTAAFPLLQSVGNTPVRSKTLAAGESINFNVSLKDLSWTDTISSGYPLASRNSISTVLPGNYNLFLELLQAEAQDSSDQNRKFKRTISNQIAVKVR